MGPAIATKILLQSGLNDRYELIHLNTTVNQSISHLGQFSPAKVFRNFSLYWRMFSLLRKHRPDLVLIPISQTTVGFVKDAPFILLGKWLGGKVLLQLRGSNFRNWISAAGRPVRWLVRQSFRGTAGVIVLGEKLRPLFSDYFAPSQTYVVPNGSNYEVPKAEKQARPQVLYLANLIPTKGILDVFQAVAALQRKGVEFDFHAVGSWLNPDFEVEAKALIEREGVELHLHPPASGAEKFRHFANADVFVFPPRDPEGHPWVIVEALASGLPVVSTDQGAIVESVIDGKNGFIVPPENPKAIAEKLEELIQNEALRNQMGIESRIRYEAKFTEEKMVENLSKTFDHVLTGEKNLEQVRDFWDDNLCGHHFVEDEYMSPAFFKHYREFRYKKTHHLNTYIDWAGSAGKDVLEVGLGIGSDGSRWAKNAQSYTGIDLTNEAVIATKKHLELLGLKGNVVQGNAESLPFENGQFGIVYSHGVIHHTTHIDRALAEINRVTRPDGELILMLYAKGSFNYWLRIQGWFRAKFLLAWLKRQLGLKNKDPWKSHLENWKRKGWKYFSWSEWPHHCTDGPDCEIANIYTQKQIRRMLKTAGYQITDMKKAHFPVGLSPKTEQRLGRFMGFHQLIWAKKETEAA